MKGEEKACSDFLWCTKVNFKDGVKKIILSKADCLRLLLLDFNQNFILAFQKASSQKTTSKAATATSIKGVSLMKTS